MKSKSSSKKLNIGPPQWPEWLDWKILGIVAMVFLFVLAMSLSEPLPQSNQTTGLAQIQVTMLPERTGTPIPLEWQTNREMGDGIVLGATALVLIIVGGTINAIRRQR